MDVLNLANNHSKDYGTTALLDTFHWLKRFGMTGVGAGWNSAEARRPRIVKRLGLKVAFVGFSDINPAGFGAGPSRPRHVLADPSVIRRTSGAPAPRRRRDRDVPLGSRALDPPTAGRSASRRSHSRPGRRRDRRPPPRPAAVVRRGRRVVAYSLGNFVWSAGSGFTASTGILKLSLSARGVTGRGSCRPGSRAPGPYCWDADRRLRARQHRHLSLGAGNLDGEPWRTTLSASLAPASANTSYAPMASLEREAVCGQDRRVESAFGDQLYQLRNCGRVDEPGGDRHIPDPELLEVKRRADGRGLPCSPSGRRDGRVRHELEGLRHADCLDRDVGAEAAGQLHHPLDCVLSAIVDRRSAPNWMARGEPAPEVDRDDPSRRIQLRSQNGGQSDRPGPDDCDRVARWHAPVEDANLVRGRKDVGEEQDLFVAQLSRAPCRGRCRRRAIRASSAWTPLVV